MSRNLGSEKRKKTNLHSANVIDQIIYPASESLESRGDGREDYDFTVDTGRLNM